MTSQPTHRSALGAFTFDNSYARELVGFYAPWRAAPVRQPELVLFNQELARELNLDPERLETGEGASLFAGNTTPEGAEPLAQAYAGHQFGNFVPQLGDGRALVLGEVIDRHGRRRDIQLKGSGPTPFSRGGDGRAPLGPVLREYLISEAMHVLCIPTTRALAAVTTGERVHRDEPLPGAVLTRVAASHVRIGTFQYFAVRGQVEEVRRLCHYVLGRHPPPEPASANRYLDLLRAVVERQASLVAQWMHVGFVHGVMNTDNMTISGETIDYGPCAFMDRYDPRTVFSSIDHGGRYAYANQPRIAQWNLARFAETLVPLLDTDETRAIELANEAVLAFEDLYSEHWLAGMREKLGLTTSRLEDQSLADALLDLMATRRLDYTQTFRHLGDSLLRDDPGAKDFLGDTDDATAWIARWHERLSGESLTDEPSATEARAASMHRVNPLYIPRNHQTEHAIDRAVHHDDYEPFHTLREVLSQPYAEREGFEAFTVPAPIDAPRCQTFCGT